MAYFRCGGGSGGYRYFETVVNSNTEFEAPFIPKKIIVFGKTMNYAAQVSAFFDLENNVNYYYSAKGEITPIVDKYAKINVNGKKITVFIGNATTIRAIVLG